ncbi:MAG: endolytic transglycosylase MltG [Candidatus Planktophila sp.]
MRKLRPVAFALVFIAILTYGLHAVRVNNNSAPNFEVRQILTSDPEIVVEIPIGATGSDIATILFTAGVIKSSVAYFRLAVSDKRSQKVSPGGHRLTLKIAASQALDQLLDSSRIPNLITVFEGEWNSEIVDSLRAFGFTSKQIADAFNNLVLPSGFATSEGLLFPALYNFPLKTNALDIVQAMINRFKAEKIGQEILNASGKYSAPQLLTIASIVQAEGDAGDFTKVSRVIRNRLELGMPLQMDSTVHYIKGVRGQIFLSTSSTLIASAYNTYKHYGLPPTPIGNPGALAMQAALHPAVGDWLFFITVAPGDTRFTRSNDQFVEWKFLYEKNRKAGAFK